MRVHLALLTLLGPGVLAAVAANHNYDNVTPAGPNAALGVPRPSSFATSASTDSDANRRHHDFLEESREKESNRKAAAEAAAHANELYRLELRRRNADPPLKIKRTNDATKTGTTSSSATTSSTASQSQITEFAVFTADNVPYTVTSMHGSELVDGKRLFPGSPVFIAGIDVGEASKGGIVADGTTIAFVTASTSSSMPMSTMPSTPNSSSSAAASMGSSSSAGAAAPAPTGKRGAVALGAVIGIGALIL